MKRLIIAFAALMCIVAVSAQETKSIRLMSYNIRNGIGMDRVTDLTRIAPVISAADPDVVAVQEIDSMTRRSGNTDVLASLAALVGMKHYYAPAINYDGGKYGIGLLSKTEPLSITRMPLPGREEERAIIIAEYPDFIFCATHLSLTEADRITSAEIISRIAQKSGKHTFLAGDLNDNPGTEFISRLTEKFTILTDISINTFPADAPTETIDYILVDKKHSDATKVKRTWIPKAPMASDHRPVVADVDITIQSK